MSRGEEWHPAARQMIQISPIDQIRNFMEVQYAGRLERSLRRQIF
jgi:hypothetical protein